MDQMHQHQDGIKSSLKETTVRSLTRFIMTMVASAFLLDTIIMYRASDLTSETEIRIVAHKSFSISIL